MSFPYTMEKKGEVNSSPTFSIRIVADCVALSYQVTKKLKRARTLELTAISAIIFIHCWQLGFIYSNSTFTSSNLLLLSILFSSKVIICAFSVKGDNCSFSIALMIT